MKLYRIAGCSVFTLCSFRVTFTVAVHYLGVVDFVFWEDIPFQCMGALMDEWTSHRLHRRNGRVRKGKMV